MVFRMRNSRHGVPCYELQLYGRLQGQVICVQVDVATKLQLIEGLVAAGLKQIEVTSFVSPKWVPQLADAAEVYRKIAKQADVKYPVLVPNMKVSHG